jgi:hypothetical protein
VTFVISTGCTSSITITQTAGATLTINVPVSTSTIDKTDMYGKLSTSNSNCPITGYTLLKNDGTSWTNTDRISLTEVTESGLKQPKLTIKPDVAFQEVVRVQATASGGSTGFVTVTINAACDSSATVIRTDSATYSIAVDTATGT